MRRSMMVVLALLMAVVAVAVLAVVAYAQDTVKVVADTTAVVLPTGCAGVVACAKAFIVGNQLIVTTGLTSLLLFAAAKLVPWWSKVIDTVTRVVQFITAALISWLVTMWGGTPDPGLTAIVAGVVALVVGGGIFRMGRTQPGNETIIIPKKP